MGSTLPALGPAEFRDRLERQAGRLAPEVLARLYLHFEYLVRWNPRLSLVGPGTAGELVERHYAESLAARPLLPAAGAVLVDVGSGAGFPGWVLAAARPDLEVWLVEPRRRKWAFLRHVTHRAALSCRCLDARVDAALRDRLPSTIDRVTVRAWRPAAAEWRALRQALEPAGRVLHWRSARPPAPPPGFRVGRTVALPGSDRTVTELLIGRDETP